MDIKHHQDFPTTLGSIIQDVVADFPAKPYGQILEQPKLCRYLLNRIILRLSWTYPWQEVTADSASRELGEQLFRMHLESAIYWELEEIIQQNLDLATNA